MILLQSLRVVVDKHGTVPTNFTVPKNCQFFDWSDIEEEKGKGSRGLHAKIHHFRCANKTEYMLFGSSNATPEGMGLKKNHNKELCFLLRSDSPGLLKNLGISINKPFNSLVSFEATGDLLENTSDINRVSFKYVLLFAEVEEDKLTVYLDKNVQQSIFLKVTTQSGKTNIVGSKDPKGQLVSCTVPILSIRMKIKRRISFCVRNFSLSMT